jgi:hypothetical protein
LHNYPVFCSLIYGDLPAAATTTSPLISSFHECRSLSLPQTLAEESLYDVDLSTYDVDESNALVPVVREKHAAVANVGETNIELIDVRCDAKAGMIVTVEFEEVFSGIIYSQGYYAEPKCR